MPVSGGMNEDASPAHRCLAAAHRPVPRHPLAPRALRRAGRDRLRVRLGSSSILASESEGSLAGGSLPEVPEIKLPEVKPPALPEVKAPEVKAPEVKAPEVKAPEVSAPEVKAPAGKGE